jgi:hypothetical protein
MRKRLIFEQLILGIKSFIEIFIELPSDPLYEYTVFYETKVTLVGKYPLFGNGGILTAFI